MMRIVVDTNVLASAIFFGGKPGELLRLILGSSTVSDKENRMSLRRINKIEQKDLFLRQLMKMR